MTKQRIDVFISSTSIDLPEHRAAVRDAILSLGLFPSGMEHWPVSGENPVDLCRKMVNEAEIYLGIYAHRYGWRPEGYGGQSITELEYEWAGEVRRDGKLIPRLCFIMSDSHPWPRDKMELDTQAQLDAFKNRVKARQVGFFTTPDNLKSQVLAALAPFAQRAGYRTALPYLRWLHEQSKRSGLLHVLRPRDTTSSGQSVTVDQVYTPLDIQQTVTRDEQGRILETAQAYKLAQREGEQTRETLLTAMEAAASFPRLALLGDPGSGKSMFVNYLTLCLTGQAIEADSGWLARLEEQGWEHGEILPVMVTLRDFAQDVPSDITAGAASLLFDHLERQLAKWKLDEAMPVIRQALDDGRALVLLDGLDEVPPYKREPVRDTIADFITRCHADNRVIVTCRILSYANPNWQVPDMQVETIAPFNPEKIEHFIESWYTALKALRQIDAETAQQRVADLAVGLQHPHLQDIASNPMLLTVMAIVHNHSGTLPRESAKLYDQCVDLLMMRWKPQEARSLIETLDVREDDLYRILWEIAYDAHAKQAEREGAADISEADIIGIAASHLNRDMGKAQLFCEYIEQRAGLLIGRGAPGLWRVFTFPHRTFQEYLAGCYAANNNFWELASELARKGAGWREVLLLATGHLVFNQGRVDIPLLAIDELTPAEEPPQTEADWVSMWLAGDMLALIGVQPVNTSKKGPRILYRVRQRLAELIAGGYLTPMERAAAGQTLAILGDPRTGIGLRPDGLPDILWGKVVTPGKYIIGGDEEATRPLPEQQYEIKHPYQMAQYLVTYVQFQSFLDASDGWDSEEWWNGIPETIEVLSGKFKTRTKFEQSFKYANHPRENVTWYHAVAFCRWLTAKYRAGNLLPENYVIRLPSEQEWEIAARYPDARKFPWGGDEYVGGYANADEINSKVGVYFLRTTSAVGSYPEGRNAELNLYDLAGNVWEWCLNEYGNPTNTDVGRKAIKVVRGGSWSYSVRGDRCASRLKLNPDYKDFGVGFRVLMATSYEGS